MNRASGGCAKRRTSEQAMYRWCRYRLTGARGKAMRSGRGRFSRSSSLRRSAATVSHQTPTTFILTTADTRTIRTGRGFPNRLSLSRSGAVPRQRPEVHLLRSHAEAAEDGAGHPSLKAGGERRRRQGGSRIADRSKNARIQSVFQSMRYSAEA